MSVFSLKQSWCHLKNGTSFLNSLTPVFRSLLTVCPTEYAHQPQDAFFVFSVLCSASVALCEGISALSIRAELNANHSTVRIRPPKVDRPLIGICIRI